MSNDEPTSAEALQAQLVTECRAMVSHGLAGGLGVPGWIVDVAAAQPPLSADDRAKAARAHAHLASLCAPETPAAIVLLQAGAKKARWNGLAWVALITAIAALAALLAIGLSGDVDDPRSGHVLSSAGWPLLVNGLFFLSAAALGAASSALLQLRVRADAERAMAAREQALRSHLTAKATSDRLKMVALLRDVQRGLDRGELPEELARSLDASTRALIEGDVDAIPPGPSPRSPAAPPALGAPNGLEPVHSIESPQGNGEVTPAGERTAVKAVVEDAGGAPLPGLPYEILRDGVLVGQGTTDAAGALDCEVGSSGEYEVVVRSAEPDAAAPSPSGGTVAPAVLEHIMCAWHSARRELARGIAFHGAGKSWENPPGSNRGPIVDDYLRLVSAVASPAAWCGMFQGFHFIKNAGFDIAGQIPASWTPDNRPMGRNTIFLSGVRLMLYFTKSGREHVPFPGKTATTRPRTRAECARWLDEHLGPFAPAPGDILLYDTVHPYSHVGMVASYDPATYQLVSYEGNLGDRASAWKWDLADPTDLGFYRVNLIGRFSREDFRGPPPPLDGPSPEPTVEIGRERKTS